MKKIFLLIVFLLPLYSIGQVRYNLDNNITGSYSTTKVGDQPTLLVNCTNKVTYGKLSLDFNPFYNLSYLGDKLTGNEMLFRQNISYTDSNNVSFFLLHQYTSSYVRNIGSDNMFGVGIGKKFKLNEHVTTSVSYCLLNHYRKYSEMSMYKTIRNSFRVKLRLDYQHFGVLAEYYFQPNVDDIKDINIFGTVGITVFNNKPINLVFQHVYNYISTDAVKNLQATTIGIKVKLNNDKN